MNPVYTFLNGIFNLLCGFYTSCVIFDIYPFFFFFIYKTFFIFHVPPSFLTSAQTEGHLSVLILSQTPH